ncbi:hypothetical protein FALCPG4_013510 [Fusarium falciforme]
MESWRLLPEELRLIILDMLAHDSAPKNETKLSRYPLTQYSLVCRDWQIFFERLLFRHLTLDRASLWDFEHIVCRQRCFVKHIRLNIDMKAFDRLAHTDGYIRVTPDPFGPLLRPLNNPQIPLEHLNHHDRRDDLGLRLDPDFGPGLA